MIECNHEWDSPECACALEAMIERRKIRKRISELTGIDLNTDAANREYYGNSYVYSLTNLLEQVIEKYDEVCAELQWATNYILGETEDGREQALYRALKTSKRLGTSDPRREMYRYNKPE